MHKKAFQVKHLYAQCLLGHKRRVPSMHLLVIRPISNDLVIYHGDEGRLSSDFFRVSAGVVRLIRPDFLRLMSFTNCRITVKG